MRTFACILLLFCVSGVVIGLHGQGFASLPLLKSIRFEKSSDAEKVRFELNGFYPPEVFGLTGDQLRVVCDFKKVNPEKSLPMVLETNGTFILRIRVGIYPTPDLKVRVVLALVPHKNYDIEQTFFQKDTTFVLIIRPENVNKKLGGRP